MTDYILVPFYRQLANRHKKEDLIEYETRVTGCVPRDYQQHRLDYSLVSPKWDLGHLIAADSLNGLMSQCFFGWHSQRKTAVEGLELVRRNAVPENTTPNVFEFIPPANPLATVTLHELGEIEHQGVMRQVVALTAVNGLTLDHTLTHRADGFYHEDVAFNRASNPELVRFVFQRMRELGFKSTKEETQ